VTMLASKMQLVAHRTARAAREYARIHDGNSTCVDAKVVVVMHVASCVVRRAVVFYWRSYTVLTMPLAA
jgi:hypothetical protein